ncbi:MAG: ATP phosphoribosyltransferase regulatory subunit [Pseudomonadota bacterium]
MISEIEGVFASLGGELVDPAIVLPAALPLELSGEAIRGRLCIFTDNQSRDMALRPDLTLPLALDQVKAREAGHSGEQAVRYASRAFRLPQSAEEPAEFMQVGYERFGGKSGPDIDAEVYTAVVNASIAGGAERGVTRLGDLAIFDTFVGALGLAKSVEQTLKRAFREDGGINAVLQGTSRSSTRVTDRLKNVSREDAESLVQEMLSMAGIEVVGSRTLNEVVTRLVEQSNDGRVADIPEDLRVVLAKLVDVDVPVETTAETLSRLARDAGLSDVDDALDALARRIELITAKDTRFVKQARFSVTFGRRFTYYDGFVFEIADPDGDLSKPYGAGGRYDKLLSKLSAGNIDEPAIGGVVRPDRLPVTGADQ